MGFLLLGQMDRRKNANVDVDVAVAVYVIELFYLSLFFFSLCPWLPRSCLAACTESDY